MAAGGVPEERSGEAVMNVVLHAVPGLAVGVLQARWRRLPSVRRLPRRSELLAEPLPRTGLGARRAGRHRTVAAG